MLYECMPAWQPLHYLCLLHDGFGKQNMVGIAVHPPGQRASILAVPSENYIRKAVGVHYQFILFRPRQPAITYGLHYIGRGTLGAKLVAHKVHVGGNVAEELVVASAEIV